MSFCGGYSCEIKITGFPHFVFSSLLGAQTISLFGGSVIWQLETEEFHLLHASRPPPIPCENARGSGGAANAHAPHLTPVPKQSEHTPS